MDYNNLDAILTRAEKFNKVSDKIFWAESYCLCDIEHEILCDDRLIKILKTASFLKNAHPAYLNFDEIKNLDEHFKCDGDKITVKFSDCPIEYILTYDDEDDCLHSTATGLDTRYTADFSDFFYDTIDNIENYANKFIKKIGDILQKQDNRLKQILPSEKI